MWLGDKHHELCASFEKDRLRHDCRSFDNYTHHEKAKLRTTRIKRLLELMSSYSFNLYYIKGKDMVLSDFLSRQKTDDSNPHEAMPIFFSLRRVLCENYYRQNDLIGTDKYLVQTRSEAKSGGIKVSEVHSVDKGLIPHVKPECQKSVLAPTTCPTLLHVTQGLCIRHTL